ncbi:DUF4862 family protein, partial [Escherichia coli]|uniref:DUF4862 family protein n=2 Tax=Escherichia coli TaxID=562 RepID=UPI003F8919DC
MKANNAGYIIGAYPCAPSFHQRSEEEEKEFWRQLSETPDIRGLEQPCLENFHPLGDQWLLGDAANLLIKCMMVFLRCSSGFCFYQL